MFKKILIFGFIFFFVLTSTLFAQTVVKDDFRVNDDYDIGGSNQSYPSIAMDHNGNFVVVWIDYRNIRRDIYGQRFDRLGNPLGVNFKVNDTESGDYIGFVDVAMNAKGDFVVIWMDNRKNKSDMYGQRYNSTGSPVGCNFQVNNDLLNSSNYLPSVSMNPSGEFIVVWINFQNTFHILGQRYSPTGERTGDNFEVVNLQGGKVDYFPPNVAINPKGDFVVTWFAVFSESRQGVYAIRVNATNEILESEFKANDSDNLSTPAKPDVAIDAPGNFVITWLEGTSGSHGLFAQRYNFKGEALGHNFKVNESIKPIPKRFPKVTMNLSKEFTIAWVELRDMLTIYIQHYNQHGEPQGANFRVTDFGQTWGPTNIDITKTPSGYFALTWDGYECTSDNEIFAMIFNQKGEIVKKEFKADFDFGSSSQKNPAISTSSSGKFIISWDDFRFCKFDVYAQMFNSSGELSGSNFKVNQQSFGLFSSNSVDSSGNSVIAFLGDQGIYLQRYDYDGVKLGENTFVNDELMPPFLSAPDVAMGSQGDFVVVWSQVMVPTSGIFAQLFDSQGIKLDSNFMVSEYLYSTQFSRPVKVAKSANGNFVVVWEAPYKYTYKSEIWGQLYNSSAEKIGEDFRISDSTIIMENLNPDVGMDEDGNFVVVWFGAGNILIQRFKADGSKIGLIIKALDSKTKVEKLSLAVKSNGEFLVTWTDSRNGDMDIYAQRFDAEGNHLGGNFRVNSDDGENIQTSPVVAADDNNYYFAWVDNRGPGSGYDIFCKIITFEQTFVSEQEFINKPELPLLQNYPNPFNPATTIQFRVLSSGTGKPIHTTLNIYNLLGQKVRSLVEEDKLPGSYQVIWDGKNDEGQYVSSGIYFYVLKTEDLIQTKKMIMVR